MFRRPDGLDCRTFAGTDPVSGKPRAVVYFIQCGGQTGAVKIGTALNVAARFHDLQMGNHLGLKLIAARPGGREVERKLHGKLWRDRIRGEWFEWSAALEHEVVSLSRRWKIPTLDNWPREKKPIVPFTKRKAA